MRAFKREMVKDGQDGHFDRLDRLDHLTIFDCLDRHGRRDHIPTKNLEHVSMRFLLSNPTADDQSTVVASVRVGRDQHERCCGAY